MRNVLIIHNGTEYQVSIQRLMICSKVGANFISSGQNLIQITDNVPELIFETFIHYIRQQPTPIEYSMIPQLTSLFLSWDADPLFSQLEQQIIASHDGGLALTAFSCTPSKFPLLAQQIISNFNVFSPQFPFLPAASLGFLAFGRPITPSQDRQAWLKRFDNIINQKKLIDEQSASFESHRIPNSKELIAIRQSIKEKEGNIKKLRQQLKKEEEQLKNLQTRNQTVIDQGKSVLRDIYRDNTLNPPGMKPQVAKWMQWKGEVDSARSRLESQK